MSNRVSSLEYDGRRAAPTVSIHNTMGSAYIPSSAILEDMPQTPYLHNRRILSYARRGEKLDSRLQRAWDRGSDAFLLDVNSGERTVDVRDGFAFDSEYAAKTWGNEHPIIVEIGTGQGENVVAAAVSHPENNYLAIEVYTPGVAHTMLLAQKAGLENLRIAQVNAPEFFDVVSPEVVDEIWTFFPDPWPKMKHHKRRLIQPDVAAMVRKSMAVGGLWRIATDIEDYALHVHEVLDGRDDFRNVGGISVSLPISHVGKGNAERAAEFEHRDFVESQRFAGRVLTNFERKGIEAGRVIHDLTYQAV